MSNIKNWMKIINEGSDSFDSDHSSENLVNYYDDEDRSPESGETMDFEFGDKLAIEGIIDTYNENECVINIDPQAMAMLEDLKVIDTVEGYEVLPRLDRDKYQERDGLEGPIMTRSGKVVYYDPQKGDYYDPNTDMYIDYEDFKELDRKAITAEGYAVGDYASQEEVDDIADSIKNRFMNDQNAMMYIIRNSSIEKFLDAITDVAEFNAPMEEIGSSDMSILMKEVLQNLGLDPKEVFARESVEEDDTDYPQVQSYRSEKEQVMDILKKHPQETKKMQMDGDVFAIYNTDLYMDLFDYFSEEMPYGTQKGRDGDPVEYMNDEMDGLGLLDEIVDEAEYQGKKVNLNKPIRTGTDEPKKFKVYVKDGDKVKMVRFGHQGGGKNKDAKTMRIKKSDPKRRKSFRARHNCKSPGPKTKARYWSCRMW